MALWWKRLPLLVLFLLVLKNAAGFKYGTFPNANLWWGQPSDNTFSPYAVQSSMSEAPMTGILPEEVGSNLLSKRLREKRSFDLQEFIERAVSSSSESTSNAQKAPSRPVSTAVSLPLAQLYLASVSSLLGSSGSSTTDNVDGLVASPSHGSSGPELSASSQQLLSTQVGSGSYSDVSQSSQYNPESFMNNKLGTLPLVASSQPGSAQSLPTVSMSNTQSRSDTQSVTGPFRSSLGGSYASGLLPQSQTASCQSTLGYPRPFSTSSVHAPSATSFYPSASLSLPQGVASQSSALQNLRKQFTFTGGSGTHMGSSGPLSFQGSTSYGGSPQPQDITSRFAPGSPTYSSSSLPQDVGSQSATVGSTSKLLSSVYGTKTGSSAPFTLLGSTTYSGPLQAQGTSSQLALGYPPSSSKSMFLPQAIASQSSTIHDSRKQFAFTGSSGTSPGSSAPLAYQGYTDFRQLPKSQDAYRASSPYASASLPQDVTSQFTTGQSTRKGFTSDYGTQAGSSTPFNLLGSTTYSGPLQAQDTSSQLALGYPPSSSKSMFSPQAIASQSSTIHDLRKQFAFTGSSGTSPGSSAPLAYQGYTNFRQLPKSQDAYRSSSPYASVSLPQDVTSQFTTGQSTRKGFTSDYGTQTGSSTPFNLLGSTTYSGPLQAQGTSSQLALGYPPSSSKSMFSPQAIASQSSTVHDSRKQFTFTDRSGTSPGSSAPLAFQGSTGFGQLPKTQDAYRSSSPYASVSLPQDVTSQFTTGQSTRKGFTSDYGTQAGSSTPFNLLGSTTYSGPLQAQGTSSQLALGYPPSSSKSMFSPQAIASQSSTVHDLRKQFAFTGSSGTSPGSSAPLAYQGYTDFRQLPKSQDAYRSSSPYASVSLPQDVTSQFTTGQTTRKGFTSDYGTQTGSSTPFNLLGSTTYSGPLQAQGTSSQLALGYPPSSSKSMFSPQAIASQSSTVHDSRKQFTFTDRSGTSPGSSAPLAFQGSTGFGQLPKTQDAYRSSSPYASVSLPQDVTSQFTTGQSTRKGFTSDYGTQAGSSTPFNLLASTTYSGPLQAQGTSSQLALGYPPSSSASLSSPQGVASQFSAVHGSRKQFDFSGNSETQAGSSARIILKGSTDYGGSPQPQNTASPLATGSLSYPSAHPQAFVSKPFSSDYGTQTGSSALLNQLGGTIYGGSLRPQDTAGQFASGSLYPSESLPQGFPSSSTTAQSLSKQFTSVYGTKAGSSAPFTLPVSTTYNPTPLQAQVTKSQLALGYPSSSGALSSPQGVASQSSTVQGSRKQFTSTGSSGTPAGSFAPLSLQGPTGYGQSPKPQDAFRSSPYASVALPQDVIGQSTAIQSSRKQFTSGYGTQAGSSTPFTLQKSTGYGGSPQLQDTASPLAPGSLSYQSVLLPQGFVSKQLTSGYGTQMGSSALLPLQGSTTYSESPKPQDTASNFIPGSPCYASASLPQGFPSKSTTAQASRNEFTSGYGTQAGSSAPLTLQQGTAYGGSFQTQDTPNQFSPGTFSYSNALLPQGVGSQSTTVQGPHKQYTSSYGTQMGFTAPLTFQESTSFGVSPQPQDAKSQFPLCASASFPQGVASQSTLQDSRKQFTFTGGSGSQAGTSAFFNSHGSTNYGSPQAQVTTSQFAPGSPSSYPSASLSLPQSVASHWKQNIQNLGVASSQDRSMGGFSSRVSGQSTSAPISSIGYGSSSLQSPGHFTKCSTGFPSHANPGSSSVSSQCTSDQSLTGLSRQERPGAQLDPSSLYMSVQGGASSTDGSALQRVTSQFAPGLSARDAKVPASSQYSKAVPSGSSPFMTQLFQNWQPSSSR